MTYNNSYEKQTITKQQQQQQQKSKTYFFLTPMRNKNKNQACFPYVYSNCNNNNNNNKNNTYKTEISYCNHFHQQSFHDISYVLPNIYNSFCSSSLNLFLCNYFHQQSLLNIPTSYSIITSISTTFPSLISFLYPTKENPNHLSYHNLLLFPWPSPLTMTPEKETTCQQTVLLAIFTKIQYPLALT